MDRKLLSSLGIVILIIVASLGVIAYARGYRLQPQSKSIQPTGLLAATSLPTGASIYINDRLTSATNTTINLPPGEYKIKIVKEGLIPWEKTLKLVGEIVSRADPILFPLVPDLRRLTFLSANNPVLSIDNQKIVFSVDNADFPLKSGLWILDMGGLPLGGDHSPRQIARNTTSLNFDKAILSWSSDSKQVLASFDNANYILDSNSLTPSERLLDVTATLPLTLKDWATDIKLKNDDIISKLKTPVQQIASMSAILKWSPDETKFIYVSTESATLPLVINPPLIGTNSHPQVRTIIPGAIYVYDIKEDKNFEVMPANEELLTKLKGEENITPVVKKITYSIPTPTPTPIPLTYQFTIDKATLPLQWYPSSRHLVLTEKDKITIMDYDGTNKAIVYAGPFTNSYVFPWSDGSKIVILSSLYQSQPDVKPNLYSINLR